MAIYRVYDRETIDPVSSSVGFTSTYLVAYVLYASIQAVGGDIRYTIDGTDTPTTSLGKRLPEDSYIEIWGAEALTNFRCIDDGGSATLEVIYYRSI